MKILIVDDEFESRNLLKRILNKKTPYEVIEATNGMEALEKIQSDNPQLVFLDIMMPVMNGVQVLQAIRSDSRFSSLPVIIVSAQNERSMIQQVVALGISFYLLKPYSIEEVRKRLAEIAIQIRDPSIDNWLKDYALAPEGKKKMMVVESNPQFMGFTSPFMATWFDVVEARTGVEAIRLMADENPDLVLIGDGLHLINEMTVARKIRQMPKRKLKKMIFAATNPYSPVEAEELFDGVIEKSLLMEPFLRQLYVVLRKKVL
jgi:CheY-like chemotaxis protein